MTEGPMQHALKIPDLSMEVCKVIRENPDKWAQAKTNDKLLGWFKAQVFKNTRGMANPTAVDAILKLKISEEPT